MNRKSVAQVIALFGTGLMAGLLFGDWLGPAFARSRMDAGSFVEFQQIVHINYLLTLPALSGVAIAALLFWLFTLRNQRRGAEFKVLVVAAIVILIGHAITFAVNVPINNQLEAWSTSAPPANAREIWSAWERAHVVRTVLWMLGFFLEAAAVVISVRRV